MTNDLDKLIAAVETGDAGGNLALAAFDDVTHTKYHVDAFRGSLDAAKALHEALLPGWGWSLNHMDGKAGEMYADALVDAIDPFRCHAANSTNPARAWLIAILKAYRSTK